MKSFRLWLVLLLALLLPVRGALAVAMQCSGPAASVQAQAQPAEPSAHGHASHEGHAHHHETAAHDVSSGADDPSGAPDKCNFCSSSCAVAGMVSGAMTLADAKPASAEFPHLELPPPSFLSDGQERPPRTI